MYKGSLSVLLFALLMLGTGCPVGTGWVINLGSDDDDSVAGDDDDSTPPDDDDTADDDDSTPPDDDDAVDDDDVVSDTCAPAYTLDCGLNTSHDLANNTGFGATDAVDIYSCFDAQWEAPEVTFELVAPVGGEYAIDLSGFEGDLELFLLEGGGECDPFACLDASLNGPDEDEQLIVDADAGDSFYVVVDGFANAQSSFHIELTCPGGGDDDDAADDDDAVDDDDAADDDDAVDDDDTVLPDDDDTVADDDDTVADDDDATAECPIFFVKGSSEASFELWTWNGAGFDAVPQTFDPGGNGTVWGAVAGDFDGDGDLDAISSRGGNYRAHLWSSNCDGTYTEEALQGGGFTFPDESEDVHGAADVDNDGDVDVYGWEYFSGNGIVWLNDGTGLNWTVVTDAFELDSWDPNEDGVHESVALGSYDVTADGLPDLVECSNDTQAPTTCDVHIGNGDGTFSKVAGSSLSQVVNGVAVADFTGDGHPDILGGFDDDGDAGQGWLWENAPLAPTPFSGPGVEAFDINPGNESGNDNPGYGWIFTYDFDGDGDDDVVANTLESFQNGTLNLTWIENTASGWGTPTAIGTSENSTGGATIVQSSVGMPVFP